MKPTLASAAASFGARAKEKLVNPAAEEQPEDQLRAPLEGLVKDLAEAYGLPRESVVPIGETSLADLTTRPDYTVTVHGALAGFIEVKAPGKGADPRRFKDPHDREQWDRPQSLPNLHLHRRQLIQPLAQRGARGAGARALVQLPPQEPGPPHHW